MATVPERRPQAGTTLVELVVSLVVVGIAVAGTLVAMSTALDQGVAALPRQQALAVAQAYLEEIALADYNDPDGSEAGEDRASYDDLDDYHGLANNGCLATTSACPSLGDCPCDQAGDPVAGLRGYAVAVAVTDLTLSGRAAREIAVTVTPPVGAPVGLTTYRTDY